MIKHPSSTDTRRLSVGRVAAAFFACLLLTSCQPRGGESDGVQLLLTTREFQPHSTFELRFDQDMVGQDALGKAAALSPLQIEPMLKGKFAWLTPRSGIYTPTEAPRLGTAYQFRLTSGLLNAKGQSTTVSLRRTLTTPPFQITNLRTSIRNHRQNSARPHLTLEFNAPVAPDEIAPSLVFRNGDTEVPAKVLTHKQNHLSGYRTDPELSRKSARVTPDWRTAFDQRHEVRSVNGTAVPIPPNVVSVLPATMLPLGEDWQLVVKAGLPSTWQGIRLPEKVGIDIGEVTSMSVTTVMAGNEFNKGKRLNIHFTQKPGQQPDSTSALDRVTIEPTPENLRLAPNWQSLEVAGDFQLERKYVVTVHPGIRSNIGEETRLTFRTNIVFDALPPQVRFPAESTVIAANGSGKFDLIGLNTPSIRLRGKRLNPSTAVHALRGYGRVYQDYWKGAAVPFDVVPGITMPNLNLNSRAELDVGRTISFDLRRYLGGRKGMIFLEAIPANPKRGFARATQAIVQFTDIGLLWKRHSEGTFVHVFSLKTGKPLADAEVISVNMDNEIRLQATTDRDGHAQLKFSDGTMLMVAHEDDLLVTSRRKNEMPRYGFGIPINYRSGVASQSRIQLFRDKPVCRPGDTIRFKALGRAIGDEMKPLVGEEHGQARLYISDPRSRQILQTNLNFSAMGSLDYAFTAPAHRHGRYSVSLAFAGTSAHTSFLVQDYEPNAFEVKLAVPEKLLPADEVAFPLNASYLLGKELTSARVQWSIEAQDFRFAPAGFKEFHFCNWVHDDRIRRGPGSLTRNGTGRYSGGDDFIIRTNLPPASKSPFPRNVTVTAEVTDLNQQTITDRRHTRYDSSEFYLGLRKVENRPKVGEAVRPQLIAVDRHGQPLPTNVTAQVRLRRINWHSVRVKGSGNTISYRNEWRSSDMFTTNVTTQPLKQTGTKWELASTGWALPPFREAGQYLLEAETMDANSNRVFTAHSIHVAGADQVAWDYRNAAQIELIPDQKTYAPGDHAEIFIKTPISGRALVSVECNSIHRWFTTNLTGNTPSIRIPLNSLDSPNVFASVTLLRGSDDSRQQFKEPDYRYGYCQLNVIDPRTKLAVSVKPGRPDYRPGETVAIDVAVRDHRGRPVRNAEVTLYAVDEGVLSLTGYTTPDPHSFFNRPRELAVASHISLTKLLPENPANLKFANKGHLIGGGGRALMPVRKNFVACPLWEPTLRTDRRGRVSARFKAPDGLTRYRIIAIAHDGRDRFGNATGDVRVNKPLIIEPVLPRFARRGDRITARALVMNRGDHDGEVEVTWKRNGPALTTGPATHTRRVPLKSGQTRTIAFPMTFTAVGETDWTWSVRFGSGEMFTDAVASRLPVEEPVPLLRASQVGRVFGTTNLLAPVDPVLLSGRGNITVRISNSPYLELRGGMDYLLRYPYGCVEQTSSSLLPWLLVKRDPVLGQLLQEKPARAEQAVRDGIDRLLSMQNSSGGLGYWPGDRQPQAWGSAYAAMILARAQQYGFAVPSEPMRRLADYLVSTLRNRDRRAVPPFRSEHAMAAYALAIMDRPEPTILRRMHDQRGMLSAEACALAALATLTALPDSRDQAGRLLERAADSRNDTYGLFGSAGRLQCFELMAHRRLNSDRVSELTQTLLSRRKHGRWQNTQVNGWALLALARIDDDVRPGEINGTLSWGDGNESFKMGEEPILIEKSFPLSEARRRLPMLMSLASEAGVYVQLGVEARVERTVSAVRDRGFVIERTYQELDPEGEPTTADSLAIGDTVLVTLDFRNDEEAGYVAIIDPLPAVLEAINPEFKSRNSVAGKNKVGWTSSYRELRRDRALFFRNHLPVGNHRIRYLARVRAAGESVAGPTKIEKMYEPERYGLSAPKTLTAAK
jgi:alpha-2-macroglobulin